MDSERGTAGKSLAPDSRVTGYGFPLDSLKKGDWVYFVGIKGTGMSAMAELLHSQGFRVSGSDREEVFYTDAILKELEIPFFESFEASHIRGSVLPNLVIYSAAYSFESNTEMAEAQRLGIHVCKFSDALGAYSAGFDSTGIAGVHGKTTVTALVGALLEKMRIPAQILAGSAVSSFGGRSTLILGNKYFAAETCEYRRHFLSFHPQRIILTAVESDHQDYYPGYEDIREAFVEYGRLLPAGGELIYCADDSGASGVALALKNEKPDIKLVPYGFSAAGEFKIEMFQVRDERIILRLSGFPGELRMRVPGRHTALNAAAAVALCSILVKKEFGNGENDGWNEEKREGLRIALEKFSGSKRRSEILGEANGILFMDDYGHHPTAINTTLDGLKGFYPGRRLVVSFMSHTYTRTSTLLDEFAASFEKADIILLHKIYPSARELYNGGVTGKTLFEKTRKTLGGFSSPGNTAGIPADPNLTERFFYVEEPMEACGLLKRILKPGDLFITMGAGDNWKLGEKLFNFFREYGTISVTNTEGGGS
jgi:UDP-N-acetylmuramate--alanine ligase